MYFAVAKNDSFVCWSYKLYISGVSLLFLFCMRDGGGKGVVRLVHGHRCIVLCRGVAVYVLGWGYLSEKFALACIVVMGTTTFHIYGLRCISFLF